MYKTIYSQKGTTLYSQYPEKNTGVDQILEICKATFGEPVIEGSENILYDTTYNSRFLIQFDLSDISSSIVSGKINSNARFYLVVKATEAVNLPVDYTLYVYPTSGSWTAGSGFYNNNPAITDGASWKYRSSKLVGTEWSTSSYNPLSTGSYDLIPGGGTFYTSSVASQSFIFTDPDVRMDVTRIVQQWLSGSISNNGFLVKLSDDLEQNQVHVGSIKFFSGQSHTIFLPRLEVYWDDSVQTGTGSFSEIGSEDFILYCKNLRESYSETEVAKVRLGVRERFPASTYATSSAYLNQSRLPTGSYYQIQDYVTDEVIIPFNTIGTKVSCDSNGNYVKLDINSLLPERYYKLVIKSEFDGGDTVRVIDDGHIFCVRRN